MSTPLLAQEWLALRQDHERHESMALWIKLGAVVLCFVTLAVAIDLLLAACLVLVLWLQEAILRTAQSRIATRLLQAEALMRQAASQTADAFQLHTQWLATRGSTGALLLEYLKNGCRPTVAFPYGVLLVLLAVA